MLRLYFALKTGIMLTFLSLIHKPINILKLIIMKNLKLIAFLAATSLFIWACCEGETTDDNPKTPYEPKQVIVPIPESVCVVDKDGKCPANCDDCIVRDNVIIMYKEGLSDTKKEQIRNQNGVTNYEKCSCGDDRLELWKFQLNDGETINVEHLIANIKGQDDSGDVLNGDNNFGIEVPRIDATAIYADQQPFIKDYIGNNAINIAIIDTGIDYGALSFKDASPLRLYNSSSVNCDTSLGYSGWNFIDKNADVRIFNNFADASSHGVYVTQVIADRLQKLGKKANILPVKAFDGEGKSSYWNILCALNYVNSFNDIHLVNTSFGFKTFNNPSIKDVTILEALTREMETKSLIIASAGNENENNDILEFFHYPSNNTSKNIIAVAGYEGKPVVKPTDITEITKANRSNYGVSTVDIAGPFHLDLKFNNGQQTSVYGTSFSAPFVLGSIIEKIDVNNFNPVTLKADFLNNARTASGLSGYVKDNKVVILE